MRRLSACLLVPLLVPVVLVISAGPSSADHCTGNDVPVENGLGGHICVYIPPQEPGSGGDSGPGDGSGPSVCIQAGEEIPCVTDAGVWFSSQSCYAMPASPQPPMANPAWAGHDPSEGTLWECTNTPSGSTWWWFVPNGAAPTLVDPAVMSRGLLDSMQLELATARVAPPPSYHTYVNYKNWMWVPENQWRTLTKSVSTGATTVTVTAVPRRVEWDMGPETVNCSGAGRAWVVGMPENAPTNCSYTYVDMEDPYGDTWQVSAQIVYDVDWTCAGACLSSAGTLGEVTAPPGETTTIEVLQRQTVVVR
jgi:hypothetical protein